MINLHLRQQHSIPIFLAAVINDLFSRRTMDTASEFTTTTATAPMEGTSEAGGDDEDPICLD